MQFNAQNMYKLQEMYDRAEPPPDDTDVFYRTAEKIETLLKAHNLDAFLDEIIRSPYWEDAIVAQMEADEEDERERADFANVD